MRKCYYAFHLILVSIFIAFSGSVYAQSETSVVGVKTACLKATWCTEKTAKCSQKQMNVDNYDEVHSARLQLKDDDYPDQNLPAYVLECFSVNGKQICTTGNQALDQEAFCSVQEVATTSASVTPVDNKELCKQNINNLQTLKDTPGFDYLFKYLYVDKDGIKKSEPHKYSKSEYKIPNLIWGSYTKEAIDRRFLLYQPFTAYVVGKDDASALQQATLEFSKKSEKCIPVKWDPVGRVFDSVTLEPIPQANIYLYKQYNGEFKDARQTEFNIANPFRTDSAGTFTFIVSDGIYRLSLESDARYKFDISSLTQIHPNYSKIYSNIYPAQRGQDIIQQGKVEQRDIPLRPINPEGNSYPLKVIALFTDLSKSNGSMIYQGSVTHPFSIIRVYYLQKEEAGSSRGDVAYVGQADNMGKFSFEVPPNKSDASQYLGDVEFEKVNLRSDFIIPTYYPNQGVEGTPNQPPSGQGTGTRISIHHEPILNNLQGVARAKGRSIPNASIEIFSDFSKVPFYSTKADSKGEFRIASEHLPTLPYTIRYTSENGIKTDILTSGFIGDNLNTIQKNTYNPNDAIDKTGKKISVDTRKKTSQNTNNSDGFFTPSKLGENSQTEKKITGTNETGNNQVMLVVMVILVLLGVTTAILTIYVIKRGKTPHI